MKIGIVGSEQAKFTPETERRARELVAALVASASVIVSGECHLGGIDIYAREIANVQGKPFVGFPPKVLSWEAGYKTRNQEIAAFSDRVVCITVAELPPGYTGMRFPGGCYHCKSWDHVKSGGCWTVKYAKSIGKIGEVIVVR